MTQNKSACEYILGIDLGTSSVKVGLLNLHTGALDAFHACQYDGYSEYDSTALWERTQEAIYEVSTKTGNNTNVAAIGISGQMHGVVLYDSYGKIIEPLINWRDEERYDPSVFDVLKQVIEMKSSNDTGTNLAAGYTGAILYWIEQNDQALFKKIDHFVLFADFIRAKLLGKNDHATDHTDAASTGLFDVHSGKWHDVLIAKLGLPLSIFPTVYHTAEIAGVLSESIARSLNLKAGIPIIYGGGDNQMSMLGSGLFSAASPPLINIGTGAQLSQVSSAFQEISEIEIRPFFDNQYALVGASLGGGGHYQELRDKLRKLQPNIDYPKMNEQAALIPAGAEGLFYCTGPSRSNSRRKKGFFGNMIKLQSIGHQARAVIEGILMDLHEMGDTIGLDTDQANIIGSGRALLASPVWRQIAADMFGKQLLVTKNDENAILGATLMASRGLKIFNTPNEWAHIIKYENPMAPNRANTRYYHEQYAREWKNYVIAHIE